MLPWRTAAPTHPNPSHHTTERCTTSPKSAAAQSLPCKNCSIKKFHLGLNFFFFFWIYIHDYKIQGSGPGSKWRTGEPVHTYGTRETLTQPGSSSINSQLQCREIEQSSLSIFHSIIIGGKYKETAYIQLLKRLFTGAR